mgnify:CR=1 FL=1
MFVPLDNASVAISMLLDMTKLPDYPDALMITPLFYYEVSTSGAQ